VEKTFREKKYFLPTKVCHVRVTVDLPTFGLLSLFSVLRVKNCNWNWNNQKKFAIPVFIKELGKYIQKKFNKYVNIES